MAKFIKIEEDYRNGNKYVTYINLDNVTHIFERDNNTKVCFVGDDDIFEFNIPLSEFMDLVNSAK